MGILNRLFSRAASSNRPTSTESPGRNDACWCGSGKKYKKCHLEEDQKYQAHAPLINCGST